MKLISTAILVIAGVIGLSFAGCTSHKVDYIKAHAEEVFAKQGFEIVALEGWQRGSFDCYGGRVWYVIRRKPDNGIIYHAFIACWGESDFQIYNLQAIDAIKPTK